MVTREGSGFDTRAGSRGNRPPGTVGRWLGAQTDSLGGTKIGRRVYRRLMGCDSLLLITVGRKSGAERRHRLACFPGDGGSWLIVAAAGGTVTNPAWYYNLAAHPERARIEVDGRIIAVRAGQLHGAERADAWRTIIAAAPQFARFQRKTDRELPVIRLTPRSASADPSNR